MILYCIADFLIILFSYLDPDGQFMCAISQRNKSALKRGWPFTVS